MFNVSFIVVSIYYAIVTALQATLVQDFLIQWLQLNPLWRINAPMPIKCSFLVNSNGFQKPPSILCHRPLLVEIHRLLRLIRDSEQFQGCLLHDASNIPRIKVVVQHYGVVERNCNVNELSIWKIVAFCFAICVVDSVLCHFLVLCEMETYVSLYELVEIHICPVPSFKIVVLGLCDLKRKMAALFQTTILNHAFIFLVDVHLYAS